MTEPGGYGYRFRHALLRESIAGQLLPASLLRWHRSWAEQLESAAASDATRSRGSRPLTTGCELATQPAGSMPRSPAPRRPTRSSRRLEEARMLVYALSLWSAGARRSRTRRLH